MGAMSHSQTLDNVSVAFRAGDFSHGSSPAYARMVPSQKPDTTATRPPSNVVTPFALSGISPSNDRSPFVRVRAPPIICSRTFASLDRSARLVFRAAVRRIELVPRDSRVLVLEVEIEFVTFTERLSRSKFYDSRKPPRVYRGRKIIGQWRRR